MKEYRVYLAGWMGMDENDMINMKPYAICESLEGAFKECEKAWDEELDCDEGAYIYDGEELKEEGDWGYFDWKRNKEK